MVIDIRKAKPFRRVFTLTDFGLTADATLIAGQYTKFGSYTVPAQQVVAFGSNDPNGGASTAGSTVYMRLDEATAGGTRIDGTIRFSVANATETNEVVVLEERSERLVASQYDRQLAVLLPEQRVKAGEDSKLLLKIKIDSASNKTLDFNGTNTKALIPVTVYQ